MQASGHEVSDVTLLYVTQKHIKKIPEIQTSIISINKLAELGLTLLHFYLRRFFMMSQTGSLSGSLVIERPGSKNRDTATQIATGLSNALNGLASPMPMEGTNTTTRSLFCNLTVPNIRRSYEPNFSDMSEKYGGDTNIINIMKCILFMASKKVTIPEYHPYILLVFIDKACQDLGLVDKLKAQGTSALKEDDISNLISKLMVPFKNLNNEPQL